MVEKCPKRNSIFIEWSAYHQRFECLQKDCMRTWTLESVEEWKLENPVENVYLRTTLPLDLLQRK